jgi:hypothetical protein
MKADISLVADFTDCPCGRLRTHGPGSGEAFREDLLRPALALLDVVAVDLTGADCLPPAFLDEAFGPLAAEMGAETFARRMLITIDDDPTAKRKLAESIALRARTDFPANRV